jgi:AraC-like DNA-binding protein/quercetin dioxygenase-like cupin family protein
MHREGTVTTQSERVAQRLRSVAAAREVVPADPELSARWHVHGVPSPYCRWNYHPEYEIHLITQGTGWFVVGDRIDIFAPGQLVLVGSNVPHHWISDLEPGQTLPERDVVFQFHPDWLQRSRQVLPELGRLDPLLHVARHGIEFSGLTAEVATDHLRRIGSHRGTLRLAHIFGLLGTLAESPDSDRRVLSADWFPVIDSTDDHAADRIDLAFSYIFDHLDDPAIRLGGAAREVGMSESAFSRYFTKISGQSFSDTVRKLRLAQAGKLLRETTLSVSSIAHRVGYANLSNFNRQFRTHHGATPREVRARSHSRPAGPAAHSS